MAKPTTLRKSDSARRPAGCGYCHEKISGPTHLCWDCNAPMHEDCFGALGHCATLGCVNNASAKTSASSPVLANDDNEMDADDDADEVSFRVATKRTSNKVDHISAPVNLVWGLATTTFAWIIILGVVLSSLGFILYLFSEGLKEIGTILSFLAAQILSFLAVRAFGHRSPVGCPENPSLKTEAPSPARAQVDNEMDEDAKVSFRVAPKRVIDKVDRISAPIKVAWALITTAIAWIITLYIVLISLVMILYVGSKEGLMRTIVPTLVILAVDAVFIFASYAMTRWAGLVAKELKN